MTDPIVQGWCPGAHRPMMSGDGLVVRVRPLAGELSAAQVQALCALAQRFGAGTLDLTSRANLQIRGVAPADHPALLAALEQAGLLDRDPALESRRNILMAPDWRRGDLTRRLHDALVAALPGLPPLPAKMGYAIDTGADAVLAGASADLRFERAADGRLILRADGSPRGRAVTEAEAIPALAEMLGWFIATGGPQAGRMRRHLAAQPLPAPWAQTPPRAPGPAPRPGTDAGGVTLGAAFGSLNARALAALVAASGATAMRVMPDRLFRLIGAAPVATEDFVTAPGSALLAAHACPGAPYCPQATVATRDLATRLAGRVAGGLHVSGCAKGCAHPGPADLTLVGRDGAFDLVRHGRPSDPPAARALRAADLSALQECPDALPL